MVRSLIKKIMLLKRSRILRKGKATPSWVYRFRIWAYGLAFLALCFLILESGLRWQFPQYLTLISTVLNYLVIIFFIFDTIITYTNTFPKSQYFKNYWFDFIILLPFFLNVISIQIGTGLIVVRHTIVIFKLFIRTPKFSRLLRGVRLNTAQIIVFSFMTTIFVGTILLTFPAATTDGKGATFIDALFTATSATCVTGLIVQDTPTYFTPFGQTVILVLIQLGGLGIMTFSAFIALLIGRFTLGQRKIVQEMFEEEKNIYSMIFYIFKMTFTIEVIGTVLLFFRFNFFFDEPLKALHFSVFHSISAFCNSGFSLFSDSLGQFYSDPVINIVVILLVILGGLGFIVVYELSSQIRRPRKRLSIHSRLVITTSAVCIVVGFFVIFFVEFDGALLKLPISGKLWVSLFQSVTTRTAGFNTIPISTLSSVTLTLMCLLMFIGASPGSTGGGIKTSTFAILLLSIRSTLLGKRDVDVFKRTIPTQSVIRAFALLVSALLLVAIVFMLLLVFEKKPYLKLLFEAVSAFGTVGLSTGITKELTGIGKVLIVILMYLGRIGPLTFALALTQKAIRSKISYPEARVLIG